ncbi:hypothetical protein HMPREF3214_00023 [Alloscardovia omnicolens]|nr:hypothetical protein HMPREF3214_00023 [Alloscardovia omnicolens]
MQPICIACAPRLSPLTSITFVKVHILPTSEISFARFSMETSEGYSKY